MKLPFLLQKSPFVKWLLMNIPASHGTILNSCSYFVRFNQQKPSGEGVLALANLMDSLDKYSCLYYFCAKHSNICHIIACSQLFYYSLHVR